MLTEKKQYGFFTTLGDPPPGIAKDHTFPLFFWTPFLSWENLISKYFANGNNCVRRCGNSDDDAGWVGAQAVARACFLCIRNPQAAQHTVRSALVHSTLFNVHAP